MLLLCGHTELHRTIGTIHIVLRLLVVLPVDLTPLLKTQLRPLLLEQRDFRVQQLKRIKNFFDHIIVYM